MVPQLVGVCVYHVCLVRSAFVSCILISLKIFVPTQDKETARPANTRNMEQRGSYSPPDIFYVVKLPDLKTE